MMNRSINETHRIAVIIVNWNGHRFLSDCLNSISSQTYDNYKVIFIDNGSGDDSVSFVRKNFPNIEVIEIEKNTGFAVANNIGIRKAFEDRDVEYIVPLNNDTRVDKDFLLELVRAYQEGSQAMGGKLGSVAPKILSFYEDGRIDSAGILVYKDGSAINRGLGEYDGEEYANPVEVFGPSGCACLYLREALEDVAYKESQTARDVNNREYFDEDFFMYHEDLDLAWRLQLRGWKSVYAPKAKVRHIHSATGISYSPFKSFYINRNQYYNLIKNFPFRFLVRGLLFTLYRYWLFACGVLKDKGPAARLREKSNIWEMVKIVFRSWWHVLANLPRLLKKRRFIQENKKIGNNEFEEILQRFEADLYKMVFDS
jgi:hypothetical protein